MSYDNMAVRVENLKKCYHIYDRPHHRLKQSVAGRVKSLLGHDKPQYYREFWALNDVSFDIAKGETVGIIGRNGSGKSTLLQIICGTLEPTHGSVWAGGRIAALLELGAGFNPEFTGRENVYLNAALLGLSQKEIDDRFEDIASFADIGEFINQPVKHYSSGMYARLAFAVAINVDPDILVVDEALAVGDEPFQRKCFARIEQIRSAGGTILFVSHSGSTIVNLCDRAILLHDGQHLYTGSPKRAVFFSQKLGSVRREESQKVIDEIREAQTVDTNAPAIDAFAGDNFEAITGLYVTNSNSEARQSVTEFFDASSASKSMQSYEAAGARIEAISLLAEDGRAVNQVLRNGRYRLKFSVLATEDCDAVRVFVVVRTTTGIDLAGCAFPPLGTPGFDLSANSAFDFQFSFNCTLNPATYFCSFAIQGSDGSLHHRIVDAVAFKVLPDDATFSTGIVDLGFVPLVEKRESEAIT
jgi:lipopolysaccharide transport system ATP-binding protein